MVDNEKTPQAGLDLSRPFTTDDVQNPYEETGVKTAQFQADFNTAQNTPPTTAWQYVQDIAGEQLTIEMLRQLNMPQIEPDPNFSTQRLRELMTEDSKKLPERYLEALAEANSEQHYAILRERAQQHNDAQQRLAELGWGGVAARMLASIVDPASLAIGLGTFGLSVNAARAMQLGRLGQIGANAVGGALGAAAIEKAYEGAGVPRTTEELMWAIGLGGAFGTALGPLARNPATRAEAEAMYETSMKMARGEALDAELQRLRERMPRSPADGFGRQVAPVLPEKPTVVEPPRDPAQSLARAVEDVTAAARGEAVDPLPSLQQAVDDVLSPEPSPAPAAAAPEPVSVEVAKMADAPDAPVPDQVRQTVSTIQSETVRLKEEVGRLRRELADIDPAVSRRRDFIGEYQGADKGTYRIFSQDGDPSGPYKVAQIIDGKQRTIAMDISSLRDAEALIPDQAPKPMLALSKLTDFGAPRFRKERAKEVGRDGDLRVLRQNLGRRNAYNTGQWSDRGYYLFVDDDSKPVGYIELSGKGEGFEVKTVEIDPDFRGRNLQQRTYDLIEKEIGETLKPSGMLTEKGYRQWQKRNPELVQWHRLSPDSYGEMYLSPKQLIVSREMWRLNWESAEPGSAAAQRIAQKVREFDELINSLPPEAKTQAALDSMHDMSLGSAMRPELKEQLEARLDRILPKGVKRSVIEDAYKDPSGVAAAGAYLDNLVIVSLRAEDPLLTANHETVHALRAVGAFTDREWRELTRYAQKINARERYQIDAKYGDLYRQRFGSQADDRLMEEAIAHMVADWMKGVRFGGIVDRLIERMSQVFRSIREFFGSRKATDIFEDIDSGRLAGRVDDAASSTGKPLLSFAGESSPMADHEALALAKQLENEGADRAVIWQKTGWFRGVDQKWRFEIDDSSATIRDLKAGRFREAVNHPALIASSPRLGRTLFQNAELPAGYEGFNMPGAPGIANRALPDQIAVGTQAKRDPLVIALHESQHTLQREFDFARGANPEGFQASTVDGALADVKALREAGMIPPQFAGMPDREFAKILLYARSAGEVEARAVEARLNMTASERRARAPWLDYDIPEEKQIVSFSERVSGKIADDATWNTVTEDAAPRGFMSKYRFDWSSRFLKSDNPVVRMLGNALVNESTGLQGHRVNAKPADIEQEFYFTKWIADYNRVRKPALAEYAERQKWNAKDTFTRADEFYQQVGLYVANRAPGREFDPAVVRLGNHVRTLQKEMLEYMKNPFRDEGNVGRPVFGADEVDPSDTYLWRKLDNERWLQAIETHGSDNVTRLVRGAIVSAQPDIDGAFADKLAKGYVQSVTKRLTMGEDWSIALGEGNYERLTRMMREDTNLTDEEIAAFVDRLRPRNPETGDMAGAGSKGRMPNLKRRVFLDESFVDEASGLSFRDLLDNNIENVLSQYARRVSGRVAMAKVRIRHPETGELLVDGITKDSEFEAVVRMAQSWAVDNLGVARAAELNFKDADDLRFIYNRILGNADPQQFTAPAQWMRRIRQYMNIRLLGQVGIAQLGEYGQAAGTLGVRAVMSRIPGFRRMITEAGETRLRDQLYSELENLGVGVERLHGFSWRRGLDESTGLPFEVPTGKVTDKIDNALRAGQRITYEASGMFPIQVMQERHVASAIVDKFAQTARKVVEGKNLSTGDKRRFAQLGLSEDMIQRIANQFQHATLENGVLFQNKVTRLNLNSWDDLEARAAFERAIFRYTRKLIQQNDLGNMAQFMSNPYWATLFHLRGFGFTAWSNNFLYNVHMGDPAALTAFSYSVGWNAVVRALQVQAVAATRSDGDEYLEKNLSEWELGKAAFSRAGWSSIIPMGVDTTLAFMGQPGQFNARTTGQASDAIFGNTFMSFIDQAAKGIGGGVDSLVQGRAISQAEVRNMAGLLPFSNLLPITTGLSYLIQEMPERAPRKELF